MPGAPADPPLPTVRLRSVGCAEADPNRKKSTGPELAGALDSDPDIYVPEVEEIHADASQFVLPKSGMTDMDYEMFTGATETKSLTIDVRPVAMTFEEFYCGFTADSHPSFSVTPTTGRMERRNGPPTQVTVTWCAPPHQPQPCQPRPFFRGRAHSHFLMAAHTAAHAGTFTLPRAHHQTRTIRLTPSQIAPLPGACTLVQSPCIALSTRAPHLAPQQPARVFGGARRLPVLHPTRGEGILHLLQDHVQEPMSTYGDPHGASIAVPSSRRHHRGI